MGMLKFEIDDGEGTRVMEVDLDLNPQTLTMRESIRLEDAIGSEATKVLFGGGEVAVTPKLIRALVWAKLASSIPGLSLEGFDIPIAAFASLGEEFAGDISLPMDTPDGETEVAVVTQEADSGNA
jgi:hypothetical protein